ncbi:ribosome biogenesis GTPase YlqF [Acidaminobacter hydrogenoformans]|uniref:Ribosome biogenesis GTPase A n=1 Tax=Acidaminobacter hydrogenoformans DSM 2784 TaxID=1120920 RepID=A0A1G5RSV6_9FIRM|nr:ribosome biogenesis GTPase YlqF [Acidaminobacter hydrogenoformans]SCZ76890.1 ribosome biogenesis GTPase A [Acidaminobacter hydrogenoformans DSM 2784]
MSQTINWYPGHMKKTKELIQSHLKLVDVVVELLDARIPESSRNPQIAELTKGKPRIVCMNKYDLADPKVTSLWKRHFEEEGASVELLDAVHGDGIDRLMRQIVDRMKEKRAKYLEKGRNPGPVRVMIVGIPNVGKSSLINKLVGKSATKTGNRPGVTRGKQWIRIRDDIELFDTPGILWPKIDSREVGLNLAMTGAIKDDILNIEDMAYELLRRMELHYAEALTARYGVEVDPTAPTIELMDAIALRRGCRRGGGEIDYDKVSRILLDEFRKGLIGRLSLEWPDDFIERRGAVDEDN